MKMLRLNDGDKTLIAKDVQRQVPERQKLRQNVIKKGR